MSMLGWSVIRIRGHSMAPVLEDGDFALCRAYGPHRRPSVGDVAYLRHPQYGMMVKRLEAETPEGFALSGVSAASTDRADLGVVPTHALLSRVLWRISPSGVQRLKANA